MPLLDDKVKESVKTLLSVLTRNVKLIVFTQEKECSTCMDAIVLAEEMAALSGKISIEKYDFGIDKNKTDQFKIDKVPSFAIIGATDSSSSQWKDYGIKFSGIPAGYEFTSFLNAIKMVSLGNSELSQKTKDALKTINKPINIKIFVTLTCPYCPTAVMLANRFAFENDLISAEMIESAEFTDLAKKYNVYGVPKIVINENIQFEGALPEDLFLAKILSA
ncbi:MAG: hypothetical protein A2539_07805 [Elusimicrobia bacterium RIFOXYD2_FULL_34_15]|nr:MAG: hypothetical protein A2539_07805 [Elusimicrobia bacterium RIFOXYD2_FULL_34_15]